jgi:hypothetical protein
MPWIMEGDLDCWASEDSGRTWRIPWPCGGSRTGTKSHELRRRPRPEWRPFGALQRVGQTAARRARPPDLQKPGSCGHGSAGRPMEHEPGSWRRISLLLRPLNWEKIMNLSRSATFARRQMARYAPRSIYQENRKPDHHKHILNLSFFFKYYHSHFIYSNYNFILHIFIISLSYTSLFLSIIGGV